jgi:hypothetical protein
MDAVGVGHAFCDFGHPVVVSPTAQLCHKMARCASRFLLRYKFISLPASRNGWKPNDISNRLAATTQNISETFI